MHELTAQAGNEFQLQLSEASYWRKPDPVLKVFTHFHLDGRAPPPPQEPSSSLDVLQLRQPGLYEASAAQLEHIDHDQSFAPSNPPLGKKGATAATNGASRTATTNDQGKLQLSIKAHIPILRLHIHRPAATIAKQKVAAKAAAQQATKGTRSSKLRCWPTARATVRGRTRARARTRTRARTRAQQARAQASAARAGASVGAPERGRGRRSCGRRCA